MPLARLRGADLYYEEYGVGVPILGIHGTPSTAVMWVDAAQRLAEHGRCIIYDRRGFGRSERPEPFDTVDLADHVRDAAALLDTLRAQPAIVVGRSTGGQIALALALEGSAYVGALVLLEPAAFTVDRLAQQWAEDLRHTILDSTKTDESRASEVVIGQALGDEVWASWPIELREMFEQASPAVMAEIRGVGLDLSAQPFEFSPHVLARIQQPTLVVAAADSPEVFRLISARLVALLAHAEELRVAGGHIIDPTHPEICAFIDRFVAR